MGEPGCNQGYVLVGRLTRGWRDFVSWFYRGVCGRVETLSGGREECGRRKQRVGLGQKGPRTIETRVEVGFSG